MIFIPREALRQIMDAAEAAYPGECCGLLVGKARPTGELEVARAVPARNLGKAKDRFEVDPQVWVDLTRALRGSDKRVVASITPTPMRRHSPRRSISKPPGARSCSGSSSAC